MTQPFVGELRVFPWDWSVRGWALCQGQQLGIAQNQALFALIGTTYGGNGVTTFALPDLRSCVAVGQGQGPGLSNYTMGERTGVEAVTLNITQIPQHNHMWAATTAAGTATPPKTYLGTVNRPGQGNLHAFASPAGSPVALGNAIGMNGSNQPHPNIQPYLGMNYSIALQGLFPSRN
jgi:microcystin-dependent protein